MPKFLLLVNLTAAKHFYKRQNNEVSSCASLILQCKKMGTKFKFIFSCISNTAKQKKMGKRLKILLIVHL